MGFQRPPKPALRPLDPKQLESVRKRYNLQENDFSIICKEFAKGASEGQLELFLYHCKRLDLNPILGQIHLIVQYDWEGEWDGPGEWVSSARIVIGIDGLRVRAERTGQYGGQDKPEFHYVSESGEPKSGPVYPPNTVVIATTVTVYRYITPCPGQPPVKTPFANTAFLEDYVQRDRQKNVTRMWRKVGIMLPKCAEAGSFRKGFPDLAGGLYTAEELQAEEEARQQPAQEKLAQAEKSEKGVVAAKQEVEEQKGLPAPAAQEKQEAGTAELQAEGKAKQQSVAEPTPAQQAGGSKVPEVSDTQAKAQEIVKATRDHYKDKASTALKRYIILCSSATRYEDVPKQSREALIGLLYLKLRESGPASVVSLMEEKFNEKKEEK